MKNIFLTLNLLLISLTSWSDTLIKVHSSNPASGLTLSYVSDAVLYENVKITPTEDSVGLYSYRLKISKPIIASLAGESFLIFPGDAVTITITESDQKKKFSFFGKNSENYSFLIGLKQLPKFNVRRQFSDSSVFSLYRKEAILHYKTTLSYLEAYSDQYKTSVEFDLIAKAILTIAYMENLIFPASDGDLGADQMPAEFFSDVEVGFLNRADLMVFRSYVLLLVSFNNYYVPNHGKEMYDSSLVTARIRSFRDHFVPEIANDLILLTFRNIVLNSSSTSQYFIESMYNDLKIAYGKDKPRLEKINELHNRFQILNKKIPENILNLPLMGSDGESTNLNTLIQQARRPLYIDFWASWCGPCKDEMPASEKLHQKADTLASFVYISVDKDKAKWLKAVNEIAVSGKHVLLSNEFKSPLTKYIGFNTIPRYIIISKDGILKDYDAPRPSQGSKLIQIFKSLQSD